MLYTPPPLQVGLPPAKNTKFVVTTWVLSSSECTKTSFLPGLRPGPRWGSLRRFPRSPSRLGMGTPPPNSPPLNAFGVSILLSSPLLINEIYANALLTIASWLSLTSFAAVCVRPTWTRVSSRGPVPVLATGVFRCRPPDLEQLAAGTATTRH